MRHLSTLVVSLVLAAGCASKPSGATTPTSPTASAPTARAGLRIGLTVVYVDDQDKALRFYTDVLGFAKKDDFSNSGFRWLTVADAGGAELQLALNSDPAAKAFQKAMFDQSQPALMFYTNDVKADYERIKAGGAEFTMPPTDVTMSSIATVKDGCGNLIQLTQLKR